MDDAVMTGIYGYRNVMYIFPLSGPWSCYTLPFWNYPMLRSATTR